MAVAKYFKKQIERFLMNCAGDNHRVIGYYLNIIYVLGYIFVQLTEEELCI
jgi:hypothetical protein